MKITYICNEYPPAPHGGIGTFVQTLARGMVAHGHEVTVVGWGRSASERQDRGVRVVVLPACAVRGVGWVVNRRRLHRWLMEAVQTGRTEIIETPEYDGPLPFDVPLCPVVVRLHLAGTTISRHTRRRVSLRQWWCEHRTLNRHRSWIAVSHHALRLTLETFKSAPHNHAVIYYPVTGETSPGPSENVALPEEFILYAGTVSRRKGAIILAEAARVILNCHPRLHIVFAGPVALEGGIAVDARIRSILGEQLSSRVHFLGRVDRGRVLACMRKAKVFVFPSNLETFGLVIAEAMLEGCPVVVSDSGPFPEFVHHNRTGLLVPPNNSSALSASVLQLLSDPALACAVSRQGQQHVRSRFCLERAVELNLEFYRSCLSRQVRPTPGKAERESRP